MLPGITGRYNQGWRNHPNFLWKNNQGNMQPRQSKPTQENKIDLEEALAKMVTSHTHFMNETKANM